MATKDVPKKDSAKTVEFQFIFQDDYNPVYANGAWGGIGPHGDLTMNFYHERAGVPYSVTHVFEADGVKLGEEIARDPPKDAPNIVRYVTTGVVIDEDCARKIYKWLGARLEQYDQLKKSGKK